MKFDKDKVSDKYINNLKEYSHIISFDQLPKAGDLVFHRINLENIYLPVDIVERNFNDIDFSDVDIDELLKKIDEKIAFLEAQEEAEKNGYAYNEDADNLTEDKNKDNSITENCDRRIIISEPGSGKTTFCKRVCMSYINNDRNIQKKYNLPQGAFPVLLLCRNLDDNYKEYSDFYELAYNMTTRTMTDLQVSFEEFKQMFKEKEDGEELLLLIDGMDEIFEEDKAKYFSEKLYDYVDDISKKCNLNFFITIRPASVKQLFNIKNISNVKEYTISKLSDEQILEFCHKWYSAVFPQNPEKQKNADIICDQLIKPVREVKFLTQVKTNPLQLSNLLVVSRYSGRIPSTKNKLYEEYLDLVLLWNTNLNPEDIKIQLAYIASYMTKNNLIKINEHDLKKVLDNCYKDLEGRFSTQMNSEQISRILREFEERNCVLQRRTHGAPFEFTHRQLQEYLTMYAILKGLSDEEDNEKYPIEILRQHYDQIQWREIIEMSAFTDDNRLTHDLISDISLKIEEYEKTNRDTYFLTNMIFNWIVNGIKVEGTRRKKIYEAVFKEHITDVQINDIINLISYSDNSIGTEFKEYIAAEYAKTYNTYNYFGYAYSIIRASQFYIQDINPMQAAEDMLIQSDEFDKYVAMNILMVLSWCKYVNIRNLFRRYYLTFTISDESIKTIVDFALNIHAENEPLAASVIQDLTLGGYIKDKTFVKYIDLEHFISILSESDKHSEQSINKSVEKILAVYPISSNITLDLCSVCVKEKYSNEFNKLSSTITKDSTDEDLENVLVKYNICAIIGCWSNIYELKENFCGIEKIFDKKHSDSKIVALYRRIKTHLQDMETSKPSEILFDESAMPTSISENPFKYYEKDDFEKAKQLFIENVDTDSSSYNNLAYMLRRHEISDVTINGSSYTVQDLLNAGPENDCYVIINKALAFSGCYCNVVGDYKLGIDYIKSLNVTFNRDNHNFHGAISWWESLAECGEIEGLIVLLWFLSLNIISITKLGDIEQIKRLLKAKNVNL